MWNGSPGRCSEPLFSAGFPISGSFGLSGINGFGTNPASSRVPFDRAPGYRGHDEGILVNVGYSGFSRSSVTNDIYGLYLGFDSQYLYTCRSDNRGHGFPLRCLSE